MPDSHIFQSILTKFGKCMKEELLEGGGGWYKAAKGGRRWQMVVKDGKREGDMFYGHFSMATAAFIGSILFCTMSVKNTLHGCHPRLGL